MSRFYRRSLLLLLISVFLHGSAVFAATYSNTYRYSLDDECSDLDDPFEKLNRKIFVFNSILDHFLLRPVAKGYKAIFNDYTRDKIGNFIDNTNVPLTFVNNVLQLDLDNSLLSFWQFFINTSLGLGGIFDIAADIDGLKTTPQTFGSTLARYGVGPGPYVMLPFLGGTNMRDILDTPIMNDKLNPLRYALHRDFRIGLTASSLIHKRAELLPFTDYVEKNSSDPYATIKSSLHQRRESGLRYPASYHCKRVSF